MPSSLRIVPLADAVAPSANWLLGALNCTVKPRSGWIVLLAATLTVIVAVVWPATKVTMPVGNTPPTNSDAGAACAPEPATDQLTVCAVTGA